MTQISKHSYKNLFNLNRFFSFARNKLPDYFTTAVVVGLLFAAYSTFLSKEYWVFLWANIVNFYNIFWSLLGTSKDYLIANVALSLIVFWLLKIFRPKSWLDKIKYSQKEQSSFYVSQLIKQGAQINTEKDLFIFCQDVVDILHNIFTHKSIINNATWLKPDGNKLELLCSNKNSKYFNADKNSHFLFRSEEGVIGNSWAKGAVEFYSEKQENKFYKVREQCSDRAYICCPIIEEPKNKYGIIAVGSDEDIFWENDDIESLKLISTVVMKILNDLDDGIKTKFNL